MNKTNKYLLIGGIIGIIYANISYLGIWIYSFFPIINIILILPVYITSIISAILHIPLSGDIGQNWLLFDWLVVTLFTLIISLPISYGILLLKQRNNY